ncbi:hypothetical protein FRC17_000571 [Serendipita sp. 399]|nr:hypothetical protein FRC17_000571 [Serendipita sp. 399]
MPKGASERVFEIADLVDCICEHVAVRNDEGDLINRGFFAKFARLNKLAATPALRQIWRYVYGVRKILELLPPTLLAQLSSGPIRPVQPRRLERDLERFFFYCGMIESFHFWEWESTTDVGNLEKIFTFIQNGLPSKDIFPRLRRLSFPLTYGEKNPYVGGFNLTRIEHFSALSLGNSSFSPQMASIAPLFPSLRTLQLTSDPIGYFLWKNNVLHILGPMTSLRNLIVRTDASTVDHILADVAGIPQIAVIEIDISASTSRYRTDPDFTLPPATSRRVPRSAVLKITRSDFTQIPVLLKHSQSLSISYSSLFFDILDKKSLARDKVGGSIDAIVDTCPSLQVLSLSSEESHSDFLFYRSSTAPIQYKDSIVPQTLEPLTRLRHITKLDFRLATVLVITPTLLNQMADSWPSLQHCYLSPLNRLARNDRTFTDALTLLTLPDVVEFASRCPMLHTFGAVFDVKVDEAQRTRRLEAMPSIPVSRTMKNLDVGSSAIWSSGQTATIIKTAFPLLDNLEWAKDLSKVTNRMSEAQSLLWAEVKNLVFERTTTTI